MVVAVGVVMALGQGVTAGGASAAANVMVFPVSGTAVGAPLAPAGVSAFPVRGGVGVAWAQPESFWPTAYRVYRQDGAAWVDVSGALPADARSFGDTTRALGQSATYRVVGENQEGPGPASADVTGARLATEPSVGAVDGIDMDGGLSGESTHPLASDVIDVGGLTQTDPVDVWPTRTDRSLVGAKVTMVLPRDVPGPGTTRSRSPGCREPDDVGVVVAGPDVLELHRHPHRRRGALHTDPGTGDVGGLVRLRL